MVKWILFLLVCWALGGGLLYTAQHALRNQLEVTGSWTAKTGEHSAGGKGTLGLFALGGGFVVIPMILFFTIGNSGHADSGTGAGSGASSVTTPAQTAAEKPLATFRFHTASGHTACVMRDYASAGQDSVRCDVKGASWELPLRPAECAAANWGHSLYLQTGSAGTLFCATDNVLLDRTVLDQGSYKTLGDITCSNTETFVTCKDNTFLTHGFDLNLGTYRIY